MLCITSYSIKGAILYGLSNLHVHDVNECDPSMWEMMAKKKTASSKQIVKLDIIVVAKYVARVLYLRETENMCVI